MFWHGLEVMKCVFEQTLSIKACLSFLFSSLFWERMETSVEVVNLIVSSMFHLFHEFINQFVLLLVHS